MKRESPGRRWSGIAAGLLTWGLVSGTGGGTGTSTNALTLTVQEPVDEVIAVELESEVPEHRSNSQRMTQSLFRVDPDVIESVADLEHRIKHRKSTLAAATGNDGVVRASAGCPGCTGASPARRLR